MNEALEDISERERAWVGRGDHTTQTYLCGSCQGNMQASKSLPVQTTLKVLLMVLNRLSDFTADKVDREVSHLKSLDLYTCLSLIEDHLCMPSML